MKIKSCHLCNTETSHAYRIKVKKGGEWIFVCGTCCLTSKRGDYYIYGGTWKGKKK